PNPRTDVMADRIDQSRLARAWVHSREEDTATTTVYRPEDYPFPPARGRNGFELRPDGSLVEEGPGPTDRTHHQAGTWRLNGDCLELTVPGRSAPTVLRIEALDRDRLVVSKAAPSCPPPGRAR